MEDIMRERSRIVNNKVAEIQKSGNYFSKCSITGFPANLTIGADVERDRWPVKDGLGD
jgi:hypothetical protein